MTDLQLDKLINALGEMLKSLFAPLLGQIGFSAVPAPAPSSLYTLCSWLDEWLTTYKAPKLKSSSLKSLKICIDNHIKSHIIDKPLNEITGLEVQKALNEIKGTRMRKYTYDVYNASFKQAQKIKLITENPVISVDPVSHKRKTGNALTLDQQKKFVKLLDGHERKPLFLFYLLTGCRRQEALDLKWTDIDFKSKKIRILGTKTETSDRTLPLFDKVAELLATVPKTSDRVFPYSGNSVHLQFARLKEKYRLPYRIHDLRHTFATRCLENGISMKIVQKWLGHAKMDTTADIYSHVQTDFENEEIRKYNAKI